MIWGTLAFLEASVLTVPPSGVLISKWLSNPALVALRKNVGGLHKSLKQFTVNRASLLWTKRFTYCQIIRHRQHIWIILKDNHLYFKGKIDNWMKKSHAKNLLERQSDFCHFSCAFPHPNLYLLKWEWFCVHSVVFLAVTIQPFENAFELFPTLLAMSTGIHNIGPQFLTKKSTKSPGRLHW